VEQNYPVMHGPVVNGQCLFCHEPHEATVKHLLRGNAPGLCLQCHNRADLPDKPAEHRDQKLDCLTCHVGHGGGRHGLLRPGAAVWGLASATTAPAAAADTQPVSITTQPARRP
jgi:predicted CXXCH cytochrome family protein